MFPVEDVQWRKWTNQHFYPRQGISLQEMSDAQRDAAFGLMNVSLSAKGFEVNAQCHALERDACGTGKTIIFSWANGRISSRSWASHLRRNRGTGSSKGITRLSIILS